jgi:hypothetical protein
VQVFQLVQQQGGQPPDQDLAPLLHLYKARLALACHNHKAAKKEVSGHLHSRCHALNFCSGVLQGLAQLSCLLCAWMNLSSTICMQLPAFRMLPGDQAYTDSCTCSAVYIGHM